MSIWRCHPIDGEWKQWIPGACVLNRMRTEWVSWVLRAPPHTGQGDDRGKWYALGSVGVRTQGWCRDHMEGSSRSRKSLRVLGQQSGETTFFPSRDRSVDQSQMGQVTASKMPKDGTRRNVLRGCTCQGPVSAPLHVPRCDSEERSKESRAGIRKTAVGQGRPNYISKSWSIGVQCRPMLLNKADHNKITNE